MLGFNVPTEYFNIIGAADVLGAALVNGLEILWLMHPLATGLIFAVIFLTPWLHIRDVTIATFLLASIGAGAATFAFAADIAYVVVAQIRVHHLSQGQFKVLYGPATWMQFVGWLLVWFATILVFGNCFFGVRKYV